MSVRIYMIHRITAATLLLAIKFLDDKIYTNLVYANLAEMTLEDLNSLEQEALELLEYQLAISTEEYFDYLNTLKRMVGFSLTPEIDKSIDIKNKLTFNRIS